MLLAYSATKVLIEVGRSDINMLKTRKVSIAHWGTLACNCVIELMSPPTMNL